MKSTIKKDRMGLILFLYCFGAYGCSYIGRNTFASCIKTMQADGVLSGDFDSLISAAYLIMYGVGQFINGRIIMKIPQKYSMAIGLFLSGVCNILMPVCGNQYIMLVLWAINGYANALLWPTVIRVFTEWLDYKERRTAGVNISPSIPVGMIGCYLICAQALKTDWEKAFFIAGIILCIGAVIWLVGVSAIEKKALDRAVNMQIQAPSISDNKNKAKLTLKSFFGYGLGILAIASFCNGSLKEAVVAWTPTYLQSDFGLTPSNASLISMIIPCISVTGPYLGDYFNKKYNNESVSVGIMYAISAACCGGMLICGICGLVIPAVVFLAISMSCMWGINSQLMTYTPYHFGPLGLSASVAGTLNAVIFSGSSIMTIVYGKIANASGAWRWPVVVWIAVGVIGAFCSICFGNVWKNNRPNLNENVNNK